MTKENEEMKKTYQGKLSELVKQINHEGVSEYLYRFALELMKRYCFEDLRTKDIQSIKQYEEIEKEEKKQKELEEAAERERRLKENPEAEKIQNCKFEIFTMFNQINDISKLKSILTYIQSI